MFFCLSSTSASLLIVLRTYVSSTIPHSDNFQALIDTASIAIWNGNKVVVALTIIVWGICIGFHVQSKSRTLTSSAEVPESHTNIGLVTGVARVNDQF